MEGPWRSVGAKATANVEFKLFELDTREGKKKHFLAYDSSLEDWIEDFRLYFVLFVGGH